MYRSQSFINISSRALSILGTTIIIAVLYGLTMTTKDLMYPGYNPIVSGHHAADNVYGLFGTVSGEIRKSDGNQPVSAASIAHKIAMPYAMIADLSAIVGGEIEVALSSLMYAINRHI